MSFVVWNDPAAPVNPAPSGLAQQARLDKVDLDILVSAIGGVSVVTGCVVTAQAAPNGTVQVSSGTIQVNSGPIAISAVASLTIPALPPANNRKDLIVVSSGGVVSVVTGVAALIPDVPSVPASSVALAVIELTSTTTVITAALISSKRVTAPVVQTQVLGSLALNTTIVHQGKSVLLLKGTFTAWSPTMVFRMDVGAQVNGGGFGGLAFFVANNNAQPNQPLYSPAWAYSAGDSRFGPSVQLADAHSVGGGIGLMYEQQSAMSVPLRVTGLTVGTVYTWQVVGACSGFASTAQAGRSPLAITVSPDNRTAWVANFTDNTVQPVQIGARPQWSLGLTPYSTVATAPIAVGTGPIAMAITPDGKTLVVANQTAKTLTTINARTRQVIGTSAAVSAGSLNSVALTQDGTVAWVSDTTGKVTPVTLSSLAVGAQIVVGAGTDNMIAVALSGDGKTLFVNDFTASKIYPLTLTSTTTATVGAAFTAPAAVGQPYGLGTCQTSATVLAGVNTASATIVATVIPGYNNFPSNPGVAGQQIRIPISAGPPVTYSTVTYTSCTTNAAGTQVTFSGCTGGVGTSIAGTLVIDEACWAAGTNGGAVQIRPAGIVAISANLGCGGITGVAVLADGQEVWVCSNTTPGKFAQFDAQNMALNTPAQTSSDQLWVVGLTTDGFIILPLVTTGVVFSLWAGTFTINPANPLPSGVQYLSLSASGAV